MPVTPMMQQYLDVKEQNPDAILFFRLGDFYEMFFDDAKLASRELELTLTGKDCGLSERAPMCGVPYHAVDVYVQKLIEKGYKVAICEQMTDPALHAFRDRMDTSLIDIVSSFLTRQYAGDQLVYIGEAIKVDPIKIGHQLQLLGVVVFEGLADHILFRAHLTGHLIIAKGGAAVIDRSHTEPFQRFRVSQCPKVIEVAILVCDDIVQHQHPV